MAIGYREAVAWIAYNDNSGDPEAFNVFAVEGLTTVKMLADIAEKNVNEVAKAVVAERVRARRAEKREGR